MRKRCHTRLTHGSYGSDRRTRQRLRDTRERRRGGTQSSSCPSSAATRRRALAVPTATLSQASKVLLDAAGDGYQRPIRSLKDLLFFRKHELSDAMPVAQGLVVLSQLWAMATHVGVNDGDWLRTARHRIHTPWCCRHELHVTHVQVAAYIIVTGCRNVALHPPHAAHDVLWYSSRPQIPGAGGHRMKVRFASCVGPWIVGGFRMLLPARTFTRVFARPSSQCALHPTSVHKWGGLF